MSDVLSWLLPLILGTGAGGGLLAWWVAKKKTPAEVDNIIVSGAETAVLLLKQALEESQKAHDRDNARKDAEIERLTGIVRASYARIVELETRLTGQIGGT